LSLHPVYAAVYGREHTGYTAVHGPCTLYTGVFTFTAHEHGTFYGSCTRPCTDLVHGHARAENKSHVHGQLPYSRSVHGGHGRERPCTLSVNTTVYIHGTRPCRQAVNTTVFTVRTRLCTREKWFGYLWWRFGVAVARRS